MTDPVRVFSANDTTIVKLLFGNDKFRIPRYQRPYAWTEDEISEFWSDLTDNDSNYFIGSFILNYQNKESTEFVEVIDGQQRMLSITIFMAVLRDIAKSLDEEFAKLIQRQDIAFEGRGGETTYRITCGDSTQPFFESNIQSYSSDIRNSQPKKREETLILGNYLFLWERVQELIKDSADTDKKIEQLKYLRDRVSDLLVIHIQVKNEDDAYEIFETTNARGVELSVADLVKNLIFNKIRDTRLRDSAKEKWQQIVSNIEYTETEITRFIRYYWISRYNFVTEKKLFREIKKEVSDWAKFLDDLLDASTFYYLLLSGSEEEWRKLGIKNAGKIFKAISAIRHMRVSQCYVLFMGLLRNYSELGTDPALLFSLVENFTFNYSTIGKQPGNKVEKVYSRYSIRIQQIVETTKNKTRAKKLQSTFDQLIKELKQERPARAVFREEFVGIRYKNSPQTRILIKYILSKVNAYLEKTTERNIDFSEVNIEHFTPQKPSKQWKLTKDDVKDYVNLLGNLTLVSKKINSEIGNNTPKEKVKGLSKSELAVTKHLVNSVRANNYVWDRDAILKRHDSLEQLAFEKIWAY